MYDALIHIGYPKTATTWFQNEFYSNVLNRKFVDVGLFRSIITDDIPFSFNQSNINVFESIGCAPLIICDEGIIGGNPFIAIESINRIHRSFPNCRIVLFIRNQLEMIVSKYSQYIYKNMGTASANTFLSKGPHWHRVHNFQKFHSEYLCYDRVIGHLEDLFGSDNVFVYLYEDFLANPAEFIGNYTFEHKLVIEKQVSFTHQNEGLRRGLYPIVRFMNIFTRYKRNDKYYLVHIPYWFQFCQRFYKRLNRFRIFGEKPKIEDLIGKEQLKTLYSLYQKSNANLIRYFGRDKLVKYNYPIKE